MSPILSTAAERYGPVALFVAGVIIGLFISFPDERLLLATLSVIGALLLLSTGLSVNTLLLMNTELALRLMETGFYKIIIGYGYTSMLASISLIFVGLLGFFVDTEYRHLYTMVLSGTFLWAVGSLYRILKLLNKIGGFYKEKERGLS